jgi:stage II sporulation protein P
LEDGGVEVIHDRTVHDYPSYTDAYSQSRKSIQKYLKQYPDICLVLDLHRDALQDSKGNQIGYTVEVEGQAAAKVMLVVGTDVSGLKHPNWRENLSMAVKLHVQMEKTAPGLCRPISFRSQRFNQDLSTGAVILEVGAAGNTRQEALKSIEVVAKSILALAWGTETPVW